MTRFKKGEICYLCGKKLLSSEKTDEDHVPQKGFFMTKNPPGIIKLNTHVQCNSDYTFDEQYVISLVRGTSNWNITAERIWQKRGLRSLTQPERYNLLKKIVNDTELLDGNYRTNIDKDRLLRVMDKIVRGLYFSEYNKVIESRDLRLDTKDFLYKQNTNSWKIDNSFISIGNPGEEEFKYFKRFKNGSLEYFMFFYNVYLFRVVYKNQ